jgi:hypothetical protein
VSSIRRDVCTVVTLLALTGAASLEAGDLAVALRGGTTGFGLDLTQRIVEHVNVRAGFALGGLSGTTNASLSRSGVTGNVSFDTTLRLRSFGAFVDAHSGKGDFRFTAGLVHDRNRFVLKASGAAEYVIYDEVYQLGEIESLTADVDLGRGLAPYFGIGFGNPVATSHRVTVLCDIGVIFQGAPRTKLSATGWAVGSAQLDRDLAGAQQRLNDEEFQKGYYKYYPVVSLGLAIKVF